MTSLARVLASDTLHHMTPPSLQPSRRRGTSEEEGNEQRQLHTASRSAISVVRQPLSLCYLKMRAFKRGREALEMCV